MTKTDNSMHIPFDKQIVLYNLKILGTKGG